MIGPEIHGRFLRELSREFEKHGLRVLVLGSSATLMLLGKARRMTKDIDIHTFPVVFPDHIDLLQEVANIFDGNIILQPDGASIQMNTIYEGKNVTVEIIEGGGEHFLLPEVLRDIEITAEIVEGIYVPTWEHVIIMKAEAYVDRRASEQKRKYLDDLVEIHTELFSVQKMISETELDRIIELRPSRKRAELRRLTVAIFGDVLR